MKTKLFLPLLLIIFLTIPSFSFATIVFETTGWIVGSDSYAGSFIADESPYTYQAILSDLSTAPLFGFDSVSFSINSSTSLLGSLTDFGSFTFNVTAGETLSFLLTAVGGGTMDAGLFGIQISTVSAPIPEPSTILLLGLGLLGLAGVGRNNSWKH